MASIRPWICLSCSINLNPLRHGCLKKLLPAQSKILTCSYRTTTQASSQIDGTKPTAKAVTISKSMRAYMERVQAHDELMKAEVADYEIGKRHLANIMGEDPDSFTQQDVDRAIQYLLPSGLFDKKARPMLKNPYEIFPKRKAAQFGVDGRPYHEMYFTTLPNYYSILYEISWKLEGLKALEDQMRLEGKFDEEAAQLNLSGSTWISQASLKDKVVENIQDKEYKHFVVMLERLTAHPLAHKEKEFIMNYRLELSDSTLSIKPPQVEADSDGRLFTTAEGTRKSSKAEVKVYKPGTGSFTVNGSDLRYFSNFLHRETLLFPLTLTGLVGEVDVEAKVDGGGPTGQSGAIRLGLARALTSFVSQEIRAQMRLAGLLTRDPRTRERKKVGQEGARRKFTWKKR